MITIAGVCNEVVCMYCMNCAPVIISSTQKSHVPSKGMHLRRMFVTYTPQPLILFQYKLSVANQ